MVLFFPLPSAIIKSRNKITKTRTLIDYILTVTPEKAIRKNVIEIGLSDYEFIYCSKKTSISKLNEHYEILFRPMKNY